MYSKIMPNFGGPGGHHAMSVHNKQLFLYEYVCDGYWEISIPLITWLTLTGIQFPNGPWVSGMETSPWN